MKTYKDSSTPPRTWNIAVNKISIERIKSMAGVDLLEIVDPNAKQQMLTRLYTDPIAVVDVMWAMSKPDAEKLGITPEDFAAGLTGDVLDNATTALLEDLVDFFQQSRRPLLQAALAKMKEADAMAVARAGQKIKAMDLASLLTTLENSSTNLPEPSASTLRI